MENDHKKVTYLEEGECYRWVGPIEEPACDTEFEVGKYYKATRRLKGSGVFSGSATLCTGYDGSTVDFAQVVLSGNTHDFKYPLKALEPYHLVANEDLIDAPDAPDAHLKEVKL
jgi:hypothetical protein